MQIPQLSESTSFEQACTVVLSYLQTAIPLGFWAITRHRGDSQLYLAVRDSAYDKRPGDSHLWSDSICGQMISGAGPQIAPDVEQIPAYAGAGIRQQLPIAAYVGLPLLKADGAVFGTLCGLDRSAQPAELERHGPLLRVLTRLLSVILQTDLLQLETERSAELSANDAETDALTGLYNRRGWDRFINAEEARYRTFGDTGSVVILDLDSLKEVNDRNGHDAGDAHLRTAADAIKSVTRDSDVVARLGGDEFGVLAVGANSEQAQRLVDRLAEQLTRDGTPGSIGHAACTDTTGYRGAWHQADTAMFTQKRHRHAATAQDIAPHQSNL